MWKYSKLAITDELSSVNCAISTAHPWVYGLGQSTDSGKYLSPVNAITYLSKEVAVSSENKDVVIFLVTGNSDTDFISQLNSVIDVLPVPSLTQIKRLAQSTAQLAIEKMQIPAPMGSAAGEVAALSMPSTRTALNAIAVEGAQQAVKAGFSMDSLRQSLDAFTETQGSMVAEIAAGLDELRGKSASAWVFTGQGNVVTSLVAMLKDIPEATAVHCAAVMFTGEDLTAIRGMIHEHESNAGA